MWSIMIMTVVGIGLVSYGGWRFRDWHLPNRTPRSKSRANSVSKPSATGQVECLDKPLRPSNQIPILSFDELVQISNARPLLLQIERKSRFTSHHYEQCVLPLLQGFTQFVQQLPASESDHHAQPCGLLIHALECVNFVLDIRAGKQLPQGFSTELTRKYEHQATYALIVGGLLHDVGKPIADTRVMLYPDILDSAPDPWAGLAGAMNREKYAYYTVDFPVSRERDYELHKKLPVLLLHHLVPVVAFNWLSECPSMVSEMFDYLAGTKTDGLMAQLIKDADRESVRQNLANGSRTRFATAKAIPLIERLMTGLRRLLIEGHELPLNRAGAAGFVYNGEVWFYCVRVASAVREYLQANEIVNGANSKAGLPTDDQRFFDIWQSFGAVITNPDTSGAIWYARVELTQSWTSQDGQTFLRFPLEKLYPDSSLYPPAMVGQMVVTSKLTSNQNNVSTTPATGVTTEMPRASSSGTGVEPLSVGPVLNSNTDATNTEVSTIPAGDESSNTVDALFAALYTSPAISTIDQTASMPVEGTEAKQSQPSVPAEEFLDKKFMAIPIQGAKSTAGEGSTTSGVVVDPLGLSTDLMTGEETRPVHYPEGADTPKEITAPMRVEHSLTPEQQALKKSSPKAERAQVLAKNFLAYVQEGIAKGTIAYNAHRAFYHFCDQGLLITTPNSFRDYCQKFPERFNELVDTTVENWHLTAPSLIQRALVDSDWAEPLVKGYNIHTYQVVSGAGLLKCFLIPRERAQLLFNPLPPSNTAIERLPLAKQAVLAGNSLSSKQVQQLRSLIEQEELIQTHQKSGTSSGLVATS